MIVHNATGLARFIKDYRKQRHLTQSAVGDAVGLKQATISAFENDPDTTRIDTLFRILSALNLDLELRSKGEKNTGADWREEW